MRSLGLQSQSKIYYFKIFILQKFPNSKLLEFLILLNKTFLVLTCYVKECPFSLGFGCPIVDKCRHLLAKGLRHSFHTAANKLPSTTGERRRRCCRRTRWRKTAAQGEWHTMVGRDLFGWLVSPEYSTFVEGIECFPS